MLLFSLLLQSLKVSYDIPEPSFEKGAEWVRLLIYKTD